MKKWILVMLVPMALFGQQRDDYDGSPGTSGAIGPITWVQPRAVLYDNGPLVNGSGTGSGGLDESILQTVSLGMNTLGFGHQVLNGNRVADDFTISDPQWTIDTITFFAYQTGSTTTSTMTGLTLQIWDGPPGAVGSNVVWGDTTTNVMSATGFTGILRVTESTTGTATDRPIMALTATVGIELSAGTYWLDWNADGSLGSGPWAPPITINGQGTTGNGLQSLDSGATYPAALDSGTGTPQQGFPFIIEGSSLSVPTLGQWGIAALLMALAVCGLVFTRRQRLA